MSEPSKPNTKLVEVTQKQHSKSPNDSNKHYEIAINKLRETRDKITGGGKYSERYKTIFNREVPDEHKFSLSAQCRDTMELYRKVSKGDKSDNSSYLNTRQLTTEKMKLPTSKSNATTDLNKQENALIGFKLVPEGIYKPCVTASPLTPPKTPKWNKKLKDVNIYHVTSSPSASNNNYSPPVNTSVSTSPPSPSAPPGFLPKPTTVQLSSILNGNNGNIDSNITLTHLQNVEDIITKLDEREKHEVNLKKFEEILKKYAPKAPPTKPVPSLKEPKISQEHIKIQTENNADVLKNAKNLKAEEHIFDPLKTCSEVEDLQVKGLSDNESEHNEHFTREGKERKSMNHGTKEKPSSGILNRTASDAQDKTLNATTKRRTMKDRPRKVSRIKYTFIL